MELLAGAERGEGGGADARRSTVPAHTRRADPRAGEWTAATDAMGVLQEEVAERANSLAWKAQLWRRWKKRQAFDQWRRQFLHLNRAIMERLHAVSTFHKGKTARKKAALDRWAMVCDARRRRAMKRLQEVADMRLTMLMSGVAEGADPLRHTRQLTVRWRMPLAYKTFTACHPRGQCATRDSRAALEAALGDSPTPSARARCCCRRARITRRMAAQNYHRRARRAYVASLRSARGGGGFCSPVPRGRRARRRRAR